MRKEGLSFRGVSRIVRKRGLLFFFLPLVFPTPNGILIVKKISEKSSDSRLSGGGGEIIFCN